MQSWHSIAVLGCLAILCVTATSASSAIANTAFVPGIVGAALCSMLACTQLWLALPRVWIRQRALHRLDIGPREVSTTGAALGITVCVTQHHLLFMAAGWRRCIVAASPPTRHCSAK